MDSDAVFPFSGVIARVSRDMRLPTRKRALAFLCIVLGAAAVVALSPPAAWIMGLVLLTALAWLAFIDIDRMTLPNVATYPLIALGILLPNPVAPDLVDRIAGAVSGYALLAVVAVIYRKTRGRDGIGLGDAKLFAAGGAWLGWSALPGVLLFASSLAIVCVLFLRVRGAAMTSASVVPFGPFLALGVMGIWLSSFSFAANA